MMNTALILNDLEMNQELDRAALAQVVGGYSVYYTGGWQVQLHRLEAVQLLEVQLLDWPLLQDLDAVPLCQAHAVRQGTGGQRHRHRHPSMRPSSHRLASH